MAKFVIDKKYQPKVGDYVSGMAGKRLVAGYVMEHPRHKGQPWIFTTRYGCVLCYIQGRDGCRYAVNEICPATDSPTEQRAEEYCSS